MSKRHKSSRTKGHCNLCGRCQCNSVKCWQSSLWKHLRKEGIKRRPQNTRMRRVNEDVVAT